MPLMVDHMLCAGWPLLILDLVPVGIVDHCGWWGGKD